MPTQQALVPVGPLGFSLLGLMDIIALLGPDGLKVAVLTLTVEPTGPLLGVANFLAALRRYHIQQVQHERVSRHLLTCCCCATATKKTTLHPQCCSYDLPGRPSLLFTLYV